MNSFIIILVFIYTLLLGIDIKEKHGYTHYRTTLKKPSFF